MNVYLAIILASLAGAWLLNAATSLLTLKALDPKLPVEFEGVHDQAEYARSQRYARARTAFGMVQDTAVTVLTIAFILLGGFNFLDLLARGAGQGRLVTGLLYIAALVLLSWLFSLPFNVYHTFVLEERFGFNRTTPRVFVTDLVKTGLLAVVIGIPILAGVLTFFNTLGEYAWLLAWGLAALAVVVIQYLAPAVILPLFHRFTPLPEGELKEAVEGYVRGVGMDVEGLYVVDGSKRSTKSNAFFAGLGKRKRIGLFDTLVDKFERDEIVAVLAHEAGHYKKRHVPKRMVLAILQLGVLFYLMSLFLTQPELFAAFGMERMSAHAGLVFFLLLFTPASLVLSVASHALSRKHEFEADAFAAKTTPDPEALVRALKKLAAANLSNLTPHPFDVFLSYSHPPVLERIAALRGKTGGPGGHK